MFSNVKTQIHIAMFMYFSCFTLKTSFVADFDEYDEEISTLRKNLKPKVEKLRSMEDKDSMRGMFLNPLSKDEMGLSRTCSDIMDRCLI